MADDFTGPKCQDCVLSFPLMGERDRCDKCDRLNPLPTDSEKAREIQVCVLFLTCELLCNLHVHAHMQSYPQCRICGVFGRNMRAFFVGHHQTCGRRACVEEAEKVVGASPTVGPGAPVPHSSSSAAVTTQGA